MKKIVIALTLCVVSLGVAVADPTPIDVHTKLHFGSWIPITRALKDAGIGYIGDAPHDKIQKELFDNRKGNFSIAEAVEVCVKSVSVYLRLNCYTFGKRLIVRYNEYVEERIAEDNRNRSVAAFYKKYNTVEKLKQLIKPGKRYNGAKSSGYYIAEHSGEPDMESCFSPCVFKSSNNAYVCCFMLCSDGVMVMPTEVDDGSRWTACSTKKDPNVYIWEWNDAKGKNSLKILDKKSIKAGSIYDWWSDSDSVLDYKLKSFKDMYGKYW